MTAAVPKKKPDYLEGKLFLRPQGEGHPPSWQKGRIDRRLNDDHYLIELYSWMGGSAYMTVASVASMTNWRIYDHNEGHEAWTCEGARLMEETRPSTKETT